ncbi:putative nucleotidyltransferase, Ribonuclease H [Helianthus debilis subsp. tardiflorus]
MADGTRFKVLDDHISKLQENHRELSSQLATAARQSDVALLASSLEDTKQAVNKLCVQVGLLAKNKGFPSGSIGNSDSPMCDSTPFGRHKPAPINLPRFAGSHPERWVAQANRYFDFYRITADDRFLIASFYFDDVAADWYDWTDRHDPLPNWSAFTAALIKRFGQKTLEQPEGLLAKLQQTSTVEEYRNRFEEISNRTTVALPPEFLISCYISGLRMDIKQSVLIHKPNTLEEAMEKAQLHENRIHMERGAGRVSLGSGKPILPTPKIQPTSLTSPAFPGSSIPKSATTTTVGFRRLSPSEISQKRALGLCFRCDEKYTSDHKCRAAPQLLFFDDDPGPDQSTDSGGSDTLDAALADSLQLDEVKSHSAISYNALAGGCSASTLRFQGTVKGQAVQVLLDGGSTHCFVQTRIAKFLNLGIESIPPFTVLVGSGERLPCTGVAKQVELVIQGSSVLIDFFVLPLQGWDMVLGVSWLSTLGPVVTNYATALFEFQLGATRVTWKGEPSTTADPIQFHGLKKLAHSNAIAHYFHLQLLPSQVDSMATVPTDIQQLLSEFSQVFRPPTGLPPIRLQDHRITLLPNSAPVAVRPYRYPHFQKQEVERLVQDMLSQGIIRPSCSPFSSPVLLVRKKDGTWRFCVDYRALNALTVPDRFPIPTIDELFDELHGAVYFSKLDLLSGYHQIRLQDGSIAKTAFRTHDGHYEFLVMPFGLTNAPSTFQRLMNDVFRPFLRRFVLVFFDDILIYSSTWADHLTHLRSVFQTLVDNTLVAKLSKCLFGQTSVGYLGHVISGQGIEVDPDKIDIIKKWPTPQSVKDVRSFLGLSGYYRRFIHHYASIASPLSDLLKKDTFVWTDTQDDAFCKLKTLLSSTPVLRLPDFSKPFTVETDASGTGIGAILSQEKQPIAYYSVKLSPRMQQASAYQREMFAITQAIAKWRQYLLGRKFQIITDQQSLKNLQDQVIQTPDQQKWLGKLLGYEFDILYRPGKLNAAADALSRVFSSQLMAFSSQDSSFLTALPKHLELDPVLQQLYTDVLQDPLRFPDYQIHNGLLLFRGRLVIPNDTTIKQQLLQEFHASPSGGHSGITRTFHRLSSTFFWKRMRQDVKSFVNNCSICQQVKSSSLSPAGLLQPLPIPSLIFEHIAMDFITGLPLSHGYSVIWVIVDRLSKYAHFVALSASFTSVSVASQFVQEFVRLHGVPLDIVTDRDPRFLADFWKELHRLQGTTLSFTTAYHPQSDGQTESLNKCVEMYLRCYVMDRPKDWFKFLPWAEYWYNTSFQTAAQMTPFEVVYGRKPPSLTRYIHGATSNSLVESQLLDRDEVLATLKANLLRAQSRMKSYADQHRRDVQFDIGDWVFVKLQPFRQHSVRLQRHYKLGRRFFGPYQILERIGPVAYKLQLPPEARIHNVFHVSMLRKCTGTPVQQITPLHLVDSSSTITLQPAHILDHRTLLRGSSSVPQCLVQWEGLPASEATWEDNSMLHKSFPAFSLEDKANFKGGGNVVSNMNEDATGSSPTAKPNPANKSPTKERRSQRVKNIPAKMKDYKLT